MVGGSRSRLFRTAAALVGAAAFAMSAMGCDSEPGDSEPAGAADREAAAVKAYTYTYPLVSVEVTRRQSTNLPAANPAIGAAPMNQPAPLSFLPDANFTAVVRPNVDTMYVSMFFDVSQEPLVVSVPDMGDRYHLFPLLDMWTDVDASPGPRTLGVVHGYEFAIVGPDWEGTLPEDVIEYRLPTDAGWMIGRIQVDGPEDVPNVIAIQNQIRATPLSAYGQPYTPPADNPVNPDWPREQEVARYVHDLTPQQYWDLFYSSLSHTQTRPEDGPLLEELAQIGWSPDEPLDLAALPDDERAAWEQAWPKALSQIAGDLGEEPVNGWKTARGTIGDYGDDYTARAVVAYAGLGANLPQDALYPGTSVDDRGEQLDSANTYVLSFPADEVPPVQAFWSLTMYDERGFLVANPANRFAVRGETHATAPDGTVDIYIQRESPGLEREANWLPAPADGPFNLMLRAYWPDEAIIEGSWNPPAVTRTN